MKKKIISFLPFVIHLILIFLLFFTCLMFISFSFCPTFLFLPSFLSFSLNFLTSLFFFSFLSLFLAFFLSLFLDLFLSFTFENSFLYWTQLLSHQRCNEKPFKLYQSGMHRSTVGIFPLILLWYALKYSGLNLSSGKNIPWLIL